MSQNYLDDDDLNDSDLKALFKADTREPSPELDRSVLSTARVKQQAERQSRSHYGFIRRYSAVIGCAAVLVLAVILVPLITQSPESDFGMNRADEPISAQSSELLLESSDSEKIASQTRQQGKIEETRLTPSAASDAATQNAAPQTTSVRETAGQIASSSNTSDETDLIETVPTISDNTTTAQIALADTENLDSANSDGTAVINGNNLDDTEVAAIQVQSDDASSKVQLAAQPVESASDADNSIDTKSRDQAPQFLPKTISLEPNPSDKSEYTDIKARSIQFRSTPERWVTEIKRLYVESKHELAIRELREFRLKYPNSQHEKKLPVELQKVVTSPSKKVD